MERREEEKSGDEGGQKDKRLAHPGKPVEMERRQEEKRGNLVGGGAEMATKQWWGWWGRAAPTSTPTFAPPPARHLRLASLISSLLFLSPLHFHRFSSICRGGAHGVGWWGRGGGHKAVVGRGAGQGRADGGGEVARKQWWGAELGCTRVGWGVEVRT